jgi:hypothetical protein
MVLREAALFVRYAAAALSSDFALFLGVH